MHYERNLELLNKKHVIYRRDPVVDKPTESFSWGNYYKNGTYECYTLFNSRAKINTYKSLKWHLYVLWYLNPKMDPDAFETISKLVCDKRNGFVTFEVSKAAMENMNYDVSMADLDKPPPNKLRKIIFKDYCKLDVSQKLSIVGQMVGKKRLSESEIYEAMIMIHDKGDKISISKLSTLLNCSIRTIYRNMGNELAKEKELLNQEL